MKRTTLLTVATLSMIAGCNVDDRVARMATEAADRQAAQNQEMARLNREIAAGLRRLVEADAETRREIVVVHQELQNERGELTGQWNSLESERKSIAQQRRTESMLVPIAQATGLTLLAAIVVGFCWTLLFGLRQQDDGDAQLVEMFVRDVVSDRPTLLRNHARRPVLGSNALLSDDAETP